LFLLKQKKRIVTPKYTLQKNINAKKPFAFSEKINYKNQPIIFSVSKLSGVI
jgi:hypothetical protein